MARITSFSTTTEFVDVNRLPVLETTVRDTSSPTGLRVVEIRVQGHHLFSKDQASKSTVMKSLQSQGMFNYLSFGDNGTALAYGVGDGVGVADTLNVAAHRGGHTAYNNFIKTFLEGLDAGVREGHIDLARANEIVRGTAAYLEHQLRHPNSGAALHSTDTYKFAGGKEPAKFWADLSLQVDLEKGGFKAGTAPAESALYKFGKGPSGVDGVLDVFGDKTLKILDLHTETGVNEGQLVKDFDTRVIGHYEDPNLQVRGSADAAAFYDAREKAFQRALDLKHSGHPVTERQLVGLIADEVAKSQGLPGITGVDARDPSILDKVGLWASSFEDAVSRYQVTTGSAIETAFLGVAAYQAYKIANDPSLGDERFEQAGAVFGQALGASGGGIGGGVALALHLLRVVVLGEAEALGQPADVGIDDHAVVDVEGVAQDDVGGLAGDAG